MYRVTEHNVKDMGRLPTGHCIDVEVVPLIYSTIPEAPSPVELPFVTFPLVIASLPVPCNSINLLVRGFQTDAAYAPHGLYPGIKVIKELKSKLESVQYPLLQLEHPDRDCPHAELYLPCGQVVHVVTLVCPVLFEYLPGEQAIFVYVVGQ